MRLASAVMAVGMTSRRGRDEDRCVTPPKNSGAQLASSLTSSLIAPPDRTSPATASARSSRAAASTANSCAAMVMSKWATFAPTRSDAPSSREAQRSRVEDIKRAMGEYGSNTGEEAAQAASLAAAAVVVTSPLDEAVDRRDDPAWSGVIDDELRLRKVLSKAEEEDFPDLLREWWVAVGAVLRKLGDPYETMPQSAPKELFLKLAEIAGYLGSGQIPGPIGRVAKRGHSTSPTEKRDIRVAVTYKLAVDEKLVDDPTSMNSIMTAYGAQLRTVQGWITRYDPFEQLLKFPNSLRARMEEAGSNYRRANRHTQEAIRSGAVKRKSLRAPK